MQGMILAAGLGTRMGDLTQSTPKPLIQVNGHYLIEYALHSLRCAGIREIVINLSYRAEEIKRALGSGERYGVQILYSEERNRLETGGGIANALPLFADDAFFVMSSDIITDYPVERILKEPQALAHVVMVDNPDFHSQGDFGLDHKNYANKQAKPTYTFANLAVYRKKFFAIDNQLSEAKFFRLNELLYPAIEKGLVTGEHYQGLWHNIGTHEDLLRVQTESNIPRLPPF